MNTTKKFQRRVEDFTCEACGAVVVGSGYTNHCPKCFTSKHVDVNPGDRAASCEGVMPVVNIFFQSGEWMLVHQCQRCGLEKTNSVSLRDDRNFLTTLMKKIAQNNAF